jgi:hypothetical protein
MAELNTEDLQRDIDGASEVYLLTIAGIADQVRSEIIVPFCEQHSLEFVCGMGVFFFQDFAEDIVSHDWTVQEMNKTTWEYGPEHVTEHAPEGFTHIFEVLDLNVDGSPLHHHLHDYRPMAWGATDG